jgi:hypothetical protein
VLVPTTCWLAKHKLQDRKTKERTAPERICAEPLNALRETRMQCAEIENKYLRRLRQEAHKK